MFRRLVTNSILHNSRQQTAFLSYKINARFALQISVVCIA